MLWLAEQGLTITVTQLVVALGSAAGGVGTVFWWLVAQIKLERDERLKEARACEERLVSELAKQRDQFVEANKAHAAQHEATQAWFMRQAEGARGGGAS